MAKSGPRTKPCPPAIRAGRLAKAQQFADAADMLDILVEDDNDLADAFITLSVHAGIAAADVICCCRLGEYAQGQTTVRPSRCFSPSTDRRPRVSPLLLDMKTRSGYSAIESSQADRLRAKRAAQLLIEAAKRAI